MSIVDKAKKLALDADTASRKKQIEASKVREGLETVLEKMVADMKKRLKELHNVKTLRGTLKVNFEEPCNRNNYTLAKVILDRSSSHTLDDTLLTVRAQIISGFHDYSDDCRNIPYTDATISINSEPVGYFPTTSKRYGSELSTRHSSYATKLDTIPKMMDEVAEYLSPLFMKEKP